MLTQKTSECKTEVQRRVQYDSDYLLTFLPQNGGGAHCLKMEAGLSSIVQYLRCVAALKVCGSTGGGKAASQCSGYAGRQVGKPRVHLNYLVRH